MKGTRIGSGCIISDSILGESCVAGDQMMAETGAAVVDIEEELYRAEFGAIMADNVAVGSRVLINAGTVVGTGSKIGSGSSIRGMIERTAG